MQLDSAIENPPAGVVSAALPRPRAQLLVGIGLAAGGSGWRGDALGAGGLEAVDRGGIPLNPARVNAIARDLGLEVSRKAPVEQTIERIRACLQRGAA